MTEMDNDGDGVITQEELIAAFLRQVTPAFVCPVCVSRRG